jgi:hypothetical protein
MSSYLKVSFFTAMKAAEVAKSFPGGSLLVLRLIPGSVAISEIDAILLDV